MHIEPDPGALSQACPQDTFAYEFIRLSRLAPGRPEERGYDLSQGGLDQGASHQFQGFFSGEYAPFSPSGWIVLGRMIEI